MSERDEIKLFDKISNGLKQSYDSLLRRKAALGQDMVIADADGQPIVVPAKELMEQKAESRDNQ